MLSFPETVIVKVCNIVNFSAPRNENRRYSYSDSDYVTEGPDDRKINSQNSRHSPNQHYYDYGGKLMGE